MTTITNEKAFAAAERLNEYERLRPAFGVVTLTKQLLRDLGLYQGFAALQYRAANETMPISEAMPFLSIVVDRGHDVGSAMSTADAIALFGDDTVARCLILQNHWVPAWQQGD
jgi:hypothetical protein